MSRLYRPPFLTVQIFLLTALLLAGCAAPPAPAPATPADPQPSATLGAAPLAPGEKLRVIATISLIGDVVARVGGDAIALDVLIPNGTDPHAFEPTPQDLVALNDTHVIFINGLGLEESLAPVLDGQTSDAALVSVNAGVALRRMEEPGHSEPDDHPETDPHTWFSVPAVKQWVANIEAGLSALDPANAGTYAANAQAYQRALDALDAELRALVAQVPPEKRKLVTDHDAFGYLADAYGFEVVGTIVPSISTVAAPAAADLAALQEQIRQEEVRALFVGETANPALAEQLAADTGTRIVRLYTGSLSGADGPASNYLDFMRYNLTQIVQALAE